MTEKKQYNNKIKLKPVPLLDGIEEIKEDFEERIKQGDLKYNFEILDDYVETIRAGSVTYILARPNCLALDTHVLTAKGFKQVTELTTRDKVIGIDGFPYDILDIVDTEEVNCYTLITSDGRTVTSSDNHRWLVHNEKRKWNKVFTSEQLFKYKEKHPEEFKRLSLPTFHDTYTKTTDLPIPPYLLGVLIGDGCLTQLSEGDKVIYYTKPSMELFNKIKSIENNIYWLKDNKTVAIKNQHYVKTILNYNLNVHSYRKFIPIEYLENRSVIVRKELLQGLLDTDGYQTRSHNEFSTTSKMLAYQVQQLAWSLGYRCTIKKRMGKYTKDGILKETRFNYRVLISNNRTKSQCMIKDIIQASPRKTRCPVTNAPSSLIIVDNYVVTMNTGKSLLSQILANNIAKQGKKVLICSCEMGAGLIMERQLLNLTGTTNSQLKYMYEQHRDTANKIMDSIKENSNYEYLKNIDICETGGATVEDIMQMLDCFPEFDIIIIDYIQRIKGNGTEYENITYANRELQTYARRTRKPIIICSQAKRASEQGGKMSTSLENAGAAGKGSGSIEEDADVGILLSNLSEGDDRAVLVTLFKNRFGYKDVTYKYILDNRLNFVLEQKRWIDTKNDKKKQ